MVYKLCLTSYGQRGGTMTVEKLRSVLQNAGKDFDVLINVADTDIDIDELHVDAETKTVRIVNTRDKTVEIL